MSSFQDTINIQLLYDINQVIEQNIQNKDFYFILLYESLEHLTLDANNIKELLCCMIKYILNKKIESGKANEVNDLKGIDEVAQSFISAIYELGWDSLITNNNNSFFRYKVMAKFTSKINEINNNRKKNNKSVDKLTTFNKLLSLILAKLPKEVNKILKFFKKNNKVNKNVNDIKDQRKLYAQALTSTNNTREVLKIKEIFPNLQAKKTKKIKNKILIVKVNLSQDSI